MVKICPRCGGLMKPKKDKDNTILVCSRCGYREKSNVSLKVSSRIDHSVKDKTIILPGNIDVVNLPITRDITCPKCGAHEAYYWFLQTRAADEPQTRFFKCAKCGHVWREYE